LSTLLCAADRIFGERYLPVDRPGPLAQPAAAPLKRRS
jgi:hypothetical protein